MPMEALERAIEVAGGLSALAVAIGSTPQVVQNWRKRGVPPERCADVERATGGKVTRADLRPDLFGEVPREASADTDDVARERVA